MKLIAAKNNAKKLYLEKYSIISIYRSQGIHTCLRVWGSASGEAERLLYKLHGLQCGPERTILEAITTCCITTDRWYSYVSCADLLT